MHSATRVFTTYPKHTPTTSSSSLTYLIPSSKPIELGHRSILDPSQGADSIEMDLPELPSVEDFLKNNEELPEAVMDDLQRSLAKPRQELADLDAEIKELEGRMDQLKIKRERVEKYIAQYNYVLSPIRRLPADILHNIFYHCLPTRRDPSMNATEAPLLLTRICRAWRHTAHASPPLWAQLYITFSDEDTLEDNQISYGLTKEYISDTLRRRCGAIEEWLSRSGVVPLSISLCYSSQLGATTTDLSPGKSGITLTLFRILVRFSARWQRLELRMPIEVYRIFESMFLGLELPMLSYLRTALSFQIDDHGHLVEDGPPLALFQQRYLKRISIASSVQLNNVLSNPSLLTSLSFSWMISVTEAISILRNCPNLAYVMLNLMQELPRSPPGHTPHPVERRISLPHLRALAIVDSIYSDPMGSRIYGCIDAPQLEWIDYEKETTYFDVDPICDIALAQLLQKSTKLRKLTIQADGLDTYQLRKILECAQTITHLVFGPEVRTNEKLLTTATMHMYRYSTGSHRWNFGNLFLQDSGGPQEELGRDSGSALLPCLEILEVSQHSSTTLADTTLRDIILHREGLHISEQTAPLKKVAVLFSRAKEIDISAELSTHSQSHAERAELRLEYHSRAPAPPYVHSGYGMDEFGRSWQYRDIEEEMMFS